MLYDWSWSKCSRLGVYSVDSPGDSNCQNRLLIAQAKSEPMRLMSDDPMIALYPVERI